MLISAIAACGPKFAVNQNSFSDAHIGAMMLDAQLALELMNLDDGNSPPKNLQVLMLSAEKLADGANSALKQTNLVENPTESTLINLYKDALTGVQDAVRVMKWKEDILRASERQNLLGGRLDVVDLGDVMKRYEIPTLGGPWESVPLQEMKRRLNSGPSPQLHSDERLLSMRESQRTFDPDEAVRMIWLRTKKTLAAAKDLYQQPAR